MIDPFKVARGAQDADEFAKLLKVNLTTGRELFDKLRTITDDDYLRGFGSHLQKLLERAR